MKNELKANQNMVTVMSKEVDMFDGEVKSNQVEHLKSLILGEVNLKYKKKLGALREELAKCKL